MISDMKILFQVERQLWNDAIAIRIGARNTVTGDVSIARNIVFEKIAKGAIMQDSESLSLTRAEATELMDELWRAGVRPAGMVESDSERAALKSHISESASVINRLFGLLERHR